MPSNHIGCLTGSGTSGSSVIIYSTFLTRPNCGTFFRFGNDSVLAEVCPLLIFWNPCFAKRMFGHSRTAPPSKFFAERIQVRNEISRFLVFLWVQCLLAHQMHCRPIEVSEILALLTSPTTVSEHCSVTHYRLNVAFSLKYAIFARVFMCEGHR